MGGIVGARSYKLVNNICLFLCLTKLMLMSLLLSINRHNLTNKRISTFINKIKVSNS